MIKDLNPKDAVGTGKAPLSVVPSPVLMELALAMLEGARKYGRHNYRVSGVRASVYYDAVMRHMMAWWEGEDIDPDTVAPALPGSGVNHLVKAIACIVVLRDSMRQGNWIDDRPSFSPTFMPELNAAAKGLVERYPNPPAPHTRNDTPDVTQPDSRPAGACNPRP